MENTPLTLGFICACIILIIAVVKFIMAYRRPNQELSMSLIWKAGIIAWVLLFILGVSRMMSAFNHIGSNNHVNPSFVSEAIGTSKQSQKLFLKTVTPVNLPFISNCTQYVIHSI